MKRAIQILSLGLLLSISSFTLAGGGHDRDHRDGYYGGQHRHANQHIRYNKNRKHGKKHRKHAMHHRHGNRHYVKNHRHARRHSHHGRYCYNWHPRGYVAPVVHYGYSSPGLVVVYQPGERLYIGGGR